MHAPRTEEGQEDVAWESAAQSVLVYACRDKQTHTQQSKCATGIHVGQTDTYPSSERPPPSSLMFHTQFLFVCFFLEKLFFKMRQGAIEPAENPSRKPGTQSYQASDAW